MKAINYLKFALLLVVASATVTIAQDTKAVDTKSTAAQTTSDAKPPVESRANMLKMLGLTRDQMFQIRKLNDERKPLMDLAQKRSRDANRALDEAIYSDQVTDIDVSARLKEAQIAQAEVIRIRSMNALAVRRVLNSEQLTRFREIRRRFEQARENATSRPLANRPAADTKAIPLGQQRVRAFIRQNAQRQKP
ncbi:hypothetical protein BH10ACI2_BH10ACI2_11800 [soil metagenome]